MAVSAVGKPAGRGKPGSGIPRQPGPHGLNRAPLADDDGAPMGGASPKTVDFGPIIPALSA
jgi:hypothetical protein